MNWKPMPGWLFVQRVETEDTLGSLYIPQQAIQNMTRTQYTVLASGGPAPVDPDSDEEPETPGHFQPGDWVLAPQRLAFDVQEEGLTLLSERNVWTTIKV